MRGFSEIVAVLLLVLISIAIGTVAFALIQGTVNRSMDVPDFSLPPHLLSASATISSSTEGGYIFEVNAHVTDCRGIEGTQGTLIGISGTQEEILGSSYPLLCSNNYATFRVHTNRLADTYRFYLWKYGYRSEEVNVTVTPGEGTPPG